LPGSTRRYGNPSGNRGADFGEFEIQRSGVGPGLRTRHGGNAGLHPCVEAVQLAFRDSVFADQIVCPLRVGAGQRKFAARACQARAGFGEGRREWPAVNGKQQLAPTNGRAIGEVDGGDLPDTRGRISTVRLGSKRPT
jgi:hypothetical protein